MSWILDRRLELQDILVEALGSNNVYFQPPSNLTIKTPAIVFARDDIENTFADDLVYKQSYKYMVTVIDKTADSAIVERVSKLPMCRYDRHYSADNLNHDTFIITY